MAVNYYRSDDIDAPVLTGVQGSLIALLDACLVNGYTGKTGAGWTKEFSANNRGAYRKGGTGNAYFVINDDNVANQSNYPGENAEIRGYMTMTDIDTGTNQFPNTTTQAYCGIKKSDTANTSVRNWVLIEDNGFVHLCVDVYISSAGLRVGFYSFGKFISNIQLDEYNFLIAVSDTDNGTYTYTDWIITPAQIVMARSYNQVDESQKCFAAFVQIYGNVSANGLNGFSEADNSINLSEYKIFEQNPISAKNFIRGKIPGLFFPFEDRRSQATCPIFDTFSSADSTKSYVQCKASATTTAGQSAVVQINSTWD